ncbi:NAD(P)/FAD-dependent oxidoreductase [Acuticoccus sediminis]|uniref:NAD(P)/FAD-dependent oxidoreductase n=1 Tax=Acuticoccus sediminis TaxID=2184697 RepID=UPI001CFD71EA|nr:FAD-binding oxidoreductase [Acuticoccus sediminis]
MPGPTVEPVEGAATLPAEADVVVVGGGIIGTTTALELAERGLKVVLCEKGIIAGEQSSRNWGWVRLARRDPREIELMMASIRIWEGMAERVGADVGYTQCGVVVPFYDAASEAENTEWLKNVEGRQTRIERIDRDAVNRMLPQLNYEHNGGIYAPHDGRAEPQKAAPAVARAVMAKGGTVLTGCAVRALDVEGGVVKGVITEKGRIKAGAVVVAGGAWSRLLLRQAGVTLPQLKVINSVMRTTPVEDGPTVTVRGPNFSVRKRADGGYTISTLVANDFDLTPDSFRFFMKFWPAAKMEWRQLRPRLGPRFWREWREFAPWDPNRESPFEEIRILDPKPNKRLTDRAFAAAKKALPVLEKAEVAQRWAGMIDVTPDAVPVISKVESRPGLVIATGFSGHGFGLGPAGGRLAADLASGSAPFVDPAAFRLSRFFDGSRIVPLTGV